MLVGANVHPWHDWEASITYVAQTAPRGLGIIRWDEQLPATPVPGLVARYVEVCKLGLQPMIVLVPQPVTPIASVTVWADYLLQLVPALTAIAMTTPIIEIGNEPNFWGPWPAAEYGAALRAAWDEAGQMKVSMGGLAHNDQTYLAAMGHVAKDMDYACMHLYTDGGNPHFGPFAPDDPDPVHNGKYSFVQGVKQTQAAINKPLIISEFGWSTTYIPDAQRASYFRAAVDIAKAHGVYALIAEEIGAGDGLEINLTNTLSWAAFMEASR
jgi:hypothetical protein